VDDTQRGRRVLIQIKSYPRHGWEKPDLRCQASSMSEKGQ
jgi:hypothetical protein